VFNSEFLEAIEIAQRGKTTRFNALCDNISLGQESTENLENEILQALLGMEEMQATGRMMAYVPDTCDATTVTSSIVWECCDGKSYAFGIERNSRGLELTLC